MSETRVHVQRSNAIAIIELDGEAHRNALARSTIQSMIDALDSLDDTVAVILVRGRGPAFCAGFDLDPVIEDPATLAGFIGGLSRLIRALRHHPAVVVAGVHGAAIAGGCAIVSGCDLVVATADTKFGYPVHLLGLSPVVSAPTLLQAIGDGPARSLLMAGRLIDGVEAHRLGLVDQLAADARAASKELARRVAGHGQAALRATKGWLNELDGSQNEARFEGPVQGSQPLSDDAASMTMLKRRWTTR